LQPWTKAPILTHAARFIILNSEVIFPMRLKLTGTKRAWLTGVIMATALWLFLAVFADVYFSANDDQFLLRTFTGGAPMGASNFHLFIHAIYAFPLSWLNRLFPGIAWVSIMEIGLLWLSTSTVVKSIIQCFENKKATHAYTKGVFFSLCFLLLFLFYLCARPTFTIVAASLSAACVAQLLSVDCQNATDRQIIRSMLYSLVLLVLCYGLRQIAVLPALAFCGLAFAYRFFSCFGFGKWTKRSAKPMIIILLAVAVVIGGLIAEREAEITLRGQRDLVAWSDARTSVLDYMTLEALSEEARNAVGWSDAQVTLLHNWYTMEEAISTEAFRYVRENEYNAQTRTTPGAAILDFRTRSPWIAFSLMVLFGVGAACVAGLAMRRKGLGTFLTLLAAACGCLMLLAYLAMQGRLPYRAVMVPVLPAAALVFCLIPECLPEEKRWFTPVVCLLLAVGTAVYIVPTAQVVRAKEQKWDYNTHAAMDQIALQNPDLLFIYSNELVNDMRMFPDFSSGIPHNLMFWGGWQRGSPEYISKVEAFGLDSEHFTPKDWLRPELRFLTLAEEPHPVLVEHLREKLGDNLQWEQTKMDIALYAYRFYME